MHTSTLGQVPLSEKSNTQLKTELDLATKTESKNILRPNLGLRLIS